MKEALFNTLMGFGVFETGDARVRAVEYVHTFSISCKCISWDNGDDSYEAFFLSFHVR